MVLVCAHVAPFLFRSHDSVVNGEVVINAHDKYLHVLVELREHFEIVVEYLAEDSVLVVF